MTDKDVDLGVSEKSALPKIAEPRHTYDSRFARSVASRKSLPSARHASIPTLDAGLPTPTRAPSALTPPDPTQHLPLTACRAALLARWYGREEKGKFTLRSHKLPKTILNLLTHLD